MFKVINFTLGVGESKGGRSNNETNAQGTQEIETSHSIQNFKEWGLYVNSPTNLTLYSFIGDVRLDHSHLDP